MATAPLLALSLVTLCSGLSAQAIPLQEGHDVLVASEYDTGLAFLSTDGEILDGPRLRYSGCMAYDRFSDAIFVITENDWTYEMNLLSFDPHTMQSTLIGDTHLPYGDGQLACHPATGELFTTSYVTDLYSVNRNTAALSYIGTSTYPNFTYRGLAYHPITHELYVTTGPSGQWASELYILDTTTADITSVVSIDRKVTSIAFDQHGTLYGVSWRTPFGTHELAEISITTGATTSVCVLPHSFASQSLSSIPAIESTLHLESTTPTGGQPFTVAVTGAKANAHTWIAFSLSGVGSTFIPQLNVTLGLASPGSSGMPRGSRLDGRLSHTANLPQLAGTQVWVQAVQMDVVSDVQSFTIL